MLKIGGFQKVTLLDYPGAVAANIFFAGCNFRCGFCHNPDLVEIKPETEFIPVKDVLAFLAKRQGLLEAVCLGGGEPLLQADLADFLTKIKTLGYLIKLDTNGYNSTLLQELLDLKLVDYIAMDIKASLAKYPEVVGQKIDVNKILQSIKIIKNSGINYEFRTTVLPKYHNLEEIEKIAKMIAGAEKYYLQRFNNRKTYDPNFRAEMAYPDEDLEKMQQLALKYVKNCQIRG